MNPLDIRRPVDSKLRLLTGNPGRQHVALDAVNEFERAILSDPAVGADHFFGDFATGAAYGSWRMQRRFGLRTDPVTAIFRHAPVRPRTYFAVLMGPAFRKCLPYFHFPGSKSIYLFDAWPEAQEKIASFVNRLGVERVFVSSRDGAADVQALLDKTPCQWIPEAIDPTVYRARAEAQRDIDVLAMGRRYEAHHRRIAAPLKEAGKVYRFEAATGRLVFPTREDFIDGLSRSRISICVPSNITHPERAGHIETMTVRYLQSMASKCLMLGHAPAEMVDLFGYNPVIEIDQAAPAEQILDILQHYADYAPLIERNHATVRASHTWHHRWHAIAAVLRGTSGAAPGVSESG